MSVHNKRRELFDKITRAKQRNQSQCDQMKNLNIRVSIINKVLSERIKLTREHTEIILDNGFKCNWYSYYKLHTDSELLSMGQNNIVQYIKLFNHVKQRSEYILKLRQEMLKYKCTGF